MRIPTKFLLTRVHAFHGPAAGEHAPDADVLVYDENVRILALLESAL